VCVCVCVMFSQVAYFFVDCVKKTQNLWAFSVLKNNYEIKRLRLVVSLITELCVTDMTLLFYYYVAKRPNEEIEDTMKLIERCLRV
jgi:hypothetical protein